MNVKCGLLNVLLVFMVLFFAGSAYGEYTCQGSLRAIRVYSDLRVPQGATCTLNGTFVDGNIKVEANATLRGYGVRVIGNVQADNAAQVEVLSGSTIGGNIQIKQGGGARIDSTRITGDLQFEENRQSLIANGNAIGGNLQGFKNTGGLSITANTIDANLQCKENSPAPTGGENIVYGNKEDQCANLSPSASPSAYFDTVQKLYIGYYQRPADPEGLLFWARGLASVDTNRDGSFDGENFMFVLEQFANSAESRAIYGGEITSTNISTVIDWIYMGLFNRHSEPDGLAFWGNSFNTGASTPASILWEVMKGAQNTDRDTLNNKVTASNRFTHVLDPELDGVSPFFAAYPFWAGRWLSNVTWDPATTPTEDAIRGLF